MDGTLVDSTPGVKGAWNLFRESYPTIDVNYVLNCEHLYFQYTAILFKTLSDTASHGVRTVENLKNHCGIQDPEILKVSANLTRDDRHILHFLSARGGALRKGHYNHILCRRRSRHCTSTGSQVNYR